MSHLKKRCHCLPTLAGSLGGVAFVGRICSSAITISQMTSQYNVRSANEKNILPPPLTRHVYGLGLHRLRCDAPHFDRYRAVLWLYWRQTEDDSGVHAGRPQHGSVAGVAVSTLKLHVRHHHARSAGRDVPVRHAVLDGVGRLRNRNAHSGLRLHSRLLQPPPDQRL